MILLCIVENLVNAQARHRINGNVFLFILASCSAGGADSAKGDEKKLTFLFNIPSQTLDPNLDVNYTAVRAGISETLVKISADLSIERSMERSALILTSVSLMPARTAV